MILVLLCNVFGHLLYSFFLSVKICRLLALQTACTKILTSFLNEANLCSIMCRLAPGLPEKDTIYSVSSLQQ